MIENVLEPGIVRYCTRDVSKACKSCQWFDFCTLPQKRVPRIKVLKKRFFK